MSRNQINLQKSSNSLLNWFLHTKSGCIDSEPFFVKEMIARSVSSSYKCLNPSDFSTHSFRSSIDKIDYEKYKDPFLKPVLEISDFIRQNAHYYLKGFILHGSLATLDYVPGWSDFDSIAIIRDGTLDDASEMIRLRSICQAIENMIKNLDNHQHHGIHFIAEKDLLMYPDLYLPTSLFEQSVSLLGEFDLFGHKRDSSQEQIDRFNSIYKTLERAFGSGTLQHHAYEGVYMMDNFRNYKNSMYQMKYFMSVICLLPSYFMNIRGEYLTKPESIEACRKVISKENFEIVDVSSMLRAGWKANLSLSNEIPDSAMKIIGENYFLRGYNLIKEMKSILGI